ncbi:MAG: mannose-1-phosphate guanylyltransferase/mannose-6-phosphate isomerase [Hyphomicrobiaceae bacterium]
MSKNAKMIHPFVLSGGSGTRLWPLSRSNYPKQFQALGGGEHSLLQQSCLRVAAPDFAACSVLCNNEHRFLVAEQLQLAGIADAQIVLEPVGRNTAPAALMAALVAAQRDPAALVLLMPSDHVIADTAAFQRSIGKGIEAAKDGRIVTFGVKPDKPETGYGYIEVGDVANDVHAVTRFVEKPPLETAEAYLKAGNFLWNAGIFLYASRAMIAAFETHAPDTLRHCRDALANAKQDLDFLRLDEAAYAQCENLSIDYAIVEKSDGVACVPLESDWSDLGSWHALWEIGGKDSAGNVTGGDVVLHDTRDSYVQSADGVCMSLIGMDGVIAVATQDAILLAPKERAQDVKHVVDKLKQTGRAEAEFHKRVYRPWGWYEQRGQGSRFQVKYLMVKPGAKLSLQSHHHRAEHWVVVSGTAEVTVDDKTFLMTENESTYIPLGATHRLANPGKLPALLVEIQSGSYLGEDDIVRYEDDFNRDKEGP